MAEVASTSDTDTEVETTYTYEVTAASEAGEVEDCPTVQMGAIPFFGNPAIVGIAAMGPSALSPSSPCAPAETNRR